MRVALPYKGRYSRVIDIPSNGMYRLKCTKPVFVTQLTKSQDQGYLYNVSATFESEVINRRVGVLVNTNIALKLQAELHEKLASFKIKCWLCCAFLFLVVFGVFLYLLILFLLNIMSCALHLYQNFAWMCFCSPLYPQKQMYFYLYDYFSTHRNIFCTCCNRRSFHRLLIHYFSDIYL